MASAKKLLSVDYEVFGKVQGVFFRKYTQRKAKELGLVGWVKNTATGTVVGSMQGADDKVKIMREWLAKTGSPKSKIDRCEFRNKKTLSKCEYKDFSIKKEPNESELERS